MLRGTIATRSDSCIENLKNQNREKMMVQTLWWGFGLGVFAAICAYSYGKGAGIVLAALIFLGIVLSLVAPDTFQAYLMLVGYGSGLVILASGLGLAAGAQLKAKRYWLSVLLFLPFPYMIWNTQSNESTRAEEKALAFEFVMNNKQVAELAGWPFKVIPSSSTT
jgi:hypothetical protein